MKHKYPILGNSSNQSDIFHKLIKPGHWLNELINPR